jgi:hypothetical protein
MFICWITALCLPDGEEVAFRLQLISAPYASKKSCGRIKRQFYNKVHLCRVLFILFFKKGIEAEQGTQKTQKTGTRKSKNDHASAVRVQKLLNRPFFTRGQTVENREVIADCLSCLAIALLNPGSGYEIS